MRRREAAMLITVSTRDTSRPPSYCGHAIEGVAKQEEDGLLSIGVQEFTTSKTLTLCQRWSSKLFSPSARAPPLSSTYALPFTPLTALLAPMYCDGIPESGEIFLCQPCLGLNFEDPPLARLLISGNLDDLPGDVAYRDRRSAAARSTPTSAGHARRRGVHWRLEGLDVGRV